MRRQNENEKIEGNVFKRKMILSGLINSIFDGKDITENHAKHENDKSGQATKSAGRMPWH